MSLLIKGMEMPKAGNWKTIRVYYDGTCAEPNWQGDCKVMKGCEAVPIPDHGDLIDRDELMKHEVYMPREGGNLPLVYMSYVKAAKTVIPAERSEDETD